jgi:hypothetical protein
VNHRLSGSVERVIQQRSNAGDTLFREVSEALEACLRRAPRMRIVYVEDTTTRKPTMSGAAAADAGARVGARRP